VVPTAHGTLIRAPMPQAGSGYPCSQYYQGKTEQSAASSHVETGEKLSGGHPGGDQRQGSAVPGEVRSLAKENRTSGSVSAGSTFPIIRPLRSD
jgi:hypothetical protein